MPRSGPDNPLSEAPGDAAHAAALRAGGERDESTRDGLLVLLGLMALAVGLGVARDARATHGSPIERHVVAPLPLERSAAGRLMSGARIDVRRASWADLLLIEGVGPARAHRLLAARRSGALRGLADADRIPGIGPVLIGRLTQALEFPDGGEAP